jgi:uncharacterized protein (DUF1810 family)
MKRFIDAQQLSFEAALSEIKRGRKQTHWMWYIFPQIQGLGFSETSKYYAIKDLNEAREYLKHPVLGARLIQICHALIEEKENNANNIFGSPDDLKLKSSMSLFASLENTDPVFQLVLNKFFKGERDEKTIRIIESQK